MSETGDDSGNIQSGQRRHVNVQEQGINIVFFQGFERFGAGSSSVDFSDSRILSEQERYFFYCWKFIIGNDHINHA